MGTWLKRIGLGALALVVLCTVAVFAVDAHVRSSAGSRIVSVDEAAALGDVDCVLVLGCGVHPDGRVRRDAPRTRAPARSPRRRAPPPRQPTRCASRRKSAHGHQPRRPPRCRERRVPERPVRFFSATCPCLILLTVWDEYTPLTRQAESS